MGIAPLELPPYSLLVCFYFLHMVAKWRPPQEKRGLPPFDEGRVKKKLAQTFDKFWLVQFLSVREGTREELSHHEEIYNMHYFLACRTNVVMSTLR